MSGEPDDPRAFAAELAADLRAWLEWAELTGAIELPASPLPERPAAASQAAPPLVPAPRVAPNFARYRLAAGVGIALVGVLAYARFGTGQRPVAFGPVAGTENPAPRMGPSNDPSAAPAGRVARTPSALSLNGSDRYERGVNFSVADHSESPSGGRTSARIASVAEGRVLLTDFEPFPHAQVWHEDPTVDRSWWLRAWTRGAPTGWNDPAPR